jgi:hypothetical protein
LNWYLLVHLRAHARSSPRVAPSASVAKRRPVRARALHDLALIAGVLGPSPRHRLATRGRLATSDWLRAQGCEPIVRSHFAERGGALLAELRGLLAHTADEPVAVAAAQQQPAAARDGGEGGSGGDGAAPVATASAVAAGPAPGGGAALVAAPSAGFKMSLAKLLPTLEVAIAHAQRSPPCC